MNIISKALLANNKIIDVNCINIKKRKKHKNTKVCYEKLIMPWEYSFCLKIFIIHSTIWQRSEKIYIKVNFTDFDFILATL